MGEKYCIRSTQVLSSAGRKDLPVSFFARRPLDSVSGREYVQRVRSLSGRDLSDDWCNTSCGPDGLASSPPLAFHEHSPGRYSDPPPVAPASARCRYWGGRGWFHCARLPFGGV